MPQPFVRYVCRFKPTMGWRIFNRKTGTPWGDHFPVRPDELLDELNGLARPRLILELTAKYKAAKS